MLIILQPLAGPIAVAAVGAFASHLAFAKHRPEPAPSRALVASLLAASILAAWIPNAGQTLYELGLPLPIFEWVQLASYFLFAFSIFGAWRLLRQKWQRCLLIALVPVSFAQPFLWTLAYVSWTVRGFAP
jgi:hypothetical protein